jgi:hypothetical protein
VWASDASGRMRGKEYFEELQDRDRAKIQALFERMGDHGEIRNTEKFRFEEDGLCCFKSFSRRLMCFFDGRNVVVTHGFTKKKDRLSRKELDIGQTIRTTYLADQRR